MCQGQQQNYAWEIQRNADVSVPHERGDGPGRAEDTAQAGGILRGDGKAGENIPDPEDPRGEVLEAGAEQGVCVEEGGRKRNEVAAVTKVLLGEGVWTSSCRQ